MIDNLCQKYHCLPSELQREGAELLKMTNILALADGEGDGPFGETGENPETAEIPGVADLSAFSQTIGDPVG